MNHELAVDIRSARLDSLVLIFPKEGDPAISATIELLSPEGKKVSTFSAQTAHWDVKERMTVTPMMLMAIASLREEVGREATARCAAQFLRLPAPSLAVPVQSGDVEVNGGEELPF